MKKKIYLATIIIFALTFNILPQYRNVDSRLLIATSWNLPGGSPEHNGYFSSFNYAPPFTLKWEKKINITSVPLNLALNNDFILLAGNNKTIQIIDKKNGSKVRDIDSGATFSKNYVSISGDTLFLGTKNGVSGYTISTGDKKWQTTKLYIDKIGNFTPYVILYNNVPIANYGETIAIFPRYYIVGSEIAITPLELTEDPIIDIFTNGSALAYVTEEFLVFTQSSLYEQRIKYSLIGIEKHSAGPAAVFGNYILHASNSSITKTPIENITGSGKLIVVSLGDNNSSYYSLIFDKFAIMSTPSTDGEQVIAPFSDGYVRSFDIKTGDLKWSYKTDGTVYSQPIITNTHVFFASSDSYIYALDKKNGDFIWNYKLSAPVISSTLAMDNENIYVMAKDGRLYRFEVNKENKPYKINMEVSSKTIRMGKTAEINVSVFNESNYQIKSYVNLRVEPAEIGTIENSVFIPKKPGECKIIAKTGDITAEETVIVYNKPPVLPNSIDMGDISEGEMKSESFTMTNQTDYPVSVVLELSKDIGSLSSFLSTLPPNESKDIQLTINGSLVANEGINNYHINVLTEDIERSYIKLAINKKGIIKPEIKAVTISDIDPKGIKKKYSLAIKNNNTHMVLSINAELKTDWVTIVSGNLRIQPGSESNVEFEIDQSMFAYEETKKAEIIIIWNKGKERVNITAKSVADTFPPDISINDTLEYRNAKIGIISGTIEVGSSLYLIDQNGNQIKITIEYDRFKIPVNLLPGPSINKFTLVAKDSLGNQVEKVVEIINSGILTVRMQIGNPVMTVGDKNVPISPAPMVYKGATIIPLRALSEAFGAKVEFANGEITVTLREKVVKLKIGSKIASINGTNMPVNPAPVIIQGKTMVPFRFIAEALGAQVFWDQSTKTITMQTEVWPSN